MLGAVNYSILIWLSLSRKVALKMVMPSVLRHGKSHNVVSTNVRKLGPLDPYRMDWCCSFLPAYSIVIPSAVEQRDHNSPSSAVRVRKRQAYGDS